MAEYSLNYSDRGEESEESVCSSVSFDATNSNDLDDLNTIQHTPIDKVSSALRRFGKTLFNLQHSIALGVFLSSLLITAIFWNAKINVLKILINEEDVTKDTLEVRNILLLINMFLFLYITFSMILKGISTIILKRMAQFSMYVYLLGSIAEHVVIFILLTILISIVIFKDCNFAINNSFISNFFILDLLINFLVGNCLFCVVTLFVDYIASGFNRVSFTERMLNVLRLSFLNQIMKSLKFFKGNRNQYFLYGFCKTKITRNYTPTIDKRQLGILLPEEKAPPKDSDWIYEQFKKISTNVIYKNNVEKDIPAYYADRRAIEAARAIKEHNVFHVQGLGIFFDNDKRFDTLIKNLQLDGNTPITKYFVMSMRHRLFQERKSIKKSMTQINAALKRIQQSLYFIISLMLLACSVTIAYNKKTIAVSMVSAFFGTGMVFQSSVKNTLDSIIFLFCIHPFDVGDRVFINFEGEPENLIVLEMNVFSTVFQKFDGTAVYVSNTILATKYISNIRRSGMMMESIRIQVSADTETSRIDAFRDRLECFIKTEQMIYGPTLMVNIESIETSNKLNLKIFVQYRNNWHDYPGYLYAKDKFLREMNRLLLKHKIGYSLPKQPIQIIKRRPREPERRVPEDVFTV